MASVKLIIFYVNYQFFVIQFLLENLNFYGQNGGKLKIN